MVSPLSNDKILPQQSDRNSTATSKRTSTGQHGTTTARPADDTLELSSAGRLINQEINPAKGSGAINTAEEARQLVVKIREQIETAGPKALQSHNPLVKGLLTTLLESSAA